MINVSGSLLFRRTYIYISKLYHQTTKIWLTKTHIHKIQRLTRYILINTYIYIKKEGITEAKKRKVYISIFKKKK